MSNKMNLPVNYNNCDWQQRKAVREQYVREQNGLCQYCHLPLAGQCSEEVFLMSVRVKSFPKNFFNWPVHLHHDHNTGMTIGAVHARCNAVLWQHEGV